MQKGFSFGNEPNIYDEIRREVEIDQLRLDLGRGEPMSGTTTTTRGGEPGAPKSGGAPWEGAWRDLVFLKQRLKNIEDVVEVAVEGADPDRAVELRRAGRHAAETASLLRRAEAELRTGWAAVEGTRG